MALAPLIVLYPLCLVCRFAVTALDRQVELLRGYAVAAVLGVASFFVLIPWLGPIGAAIGLLVGELTVFVVALRVLRRAAGVGPSWGILVRAAACAALAFLAVRLPLVRDLPWSLGIGVAGLVYLVLLLLVGAIPPHLLAMILSASDPASPERAARVDHAAAVVARRDLGRAMREVKLIDLLGAIDRNHVVSHLMQHDRWARLLDRYVGWSPQQLLVYLAGCLLFSLGVKLFIDADLGVDPLNSMVIGMVQALDLPWVRIGFVTSVVTILFLAVWSLWNRRWPPFSTFVTMALVGYLIDLWNLLELQQWTTAWLNPMPMLLLALLVVGYACALIIMSGIGLRVMDLLAVSFVKRLGWPFLAGKLLQEAGFVVVALLLGGPVGLGTLGFVGIVAPAIPLAMWANERLLNLPNHGLDTGGQLLRRA
jgi:uncharacterized membrane protein YczE